MQSLLPQDKVALKRLEADIKRVLSANGILLVGVDTQNLADEFQEYLTSKHSLKLFKFEDEILRELADNDKYDKKSFFLANIYDHANQKSVVAGLQFQRDFIYLKNIKIVVILSNELLEYLKVEAGDLFSTVKFSYSFSDHSFNYTSEVKDEKLNKAIATYEKYLHSDIKHNNILYDLISAIAIEAFNISNFTLALEYSNLSLQYTDNQKNKKSNTFGNIGLTHHNLGNYQESLKYQRKALDIRKKLKDKNGEATSLSNIGNSYYRLGNLKVALKYQNDSLIIAKRIGNKDSIATSLVTIGNIYSGLGELENDLKYQNESLKIYKEIGKKSGVATSLGNIGSIYGELGEYETALKYQNESLKITRELEDKSGIAFSLGSIGSIYRELEEHETALKYQNESLKIYKEIGSKNNIAVMLGNIGETYQKFGEFETALKYCKETLKIAKAKKFIKLEAETLKDIAKTYELQNNLKEAKTNYLLSKHLFEAMKLEKKVEEITKKIDALAL